MHGEQPHLLVGNESMFLRFRGFLRKVLASQYCKRIICDTQAAKQALVSAFESEQLGDNVTVVYPAAPRRHFHERPGASSKTPVRLLFVGSSNVDAIWQFRDKGGFVLLEIFKLLRQRYQNVTLTIRSRVPSAVRSKWGKVRGVTIIEEVLPQEQLEQLFVVSDVLVCPAHLTPSLIFVEAMSYELPVVTTDVWSNPELVSDGNAGLLVHHPQAHRYIVNSWAHHDWPEFHAVVNSVDPELVAGFVEKLSLLVENPELRRRMGKAGRLEVEEGRFFMRRRNESLERVLDEATIER